MFLKEVRRYYNFNNIYHRRKNIFKYFFFLSTDLDYSLKKKYVLNVIENI